MKYSTVTSKVPYLKGRNHALKNNAKSHMRSIQKRPAHIKTFFLKESVKYAS